MLLDTCIASLCIKCLFSTLIVSEILKPSSDFRRRWCCIYATIPYSFSAGLSWSSRKITKPMPACGIIACIYICCSCTSEHPGSLAQFLSHYPKILAFSSRPCSHISCPSFLLSAFDPRSRKLIVFYRIDTCTTNQAFEAVASEAVRPPQPNFDC